jgi:hypothetical protein
MEAAEPNFKSDKMLG